MFEHRTKPLLPRKEYYSTPRASRGVGRRGHRRSLGIGMIGYHGFEKMPWVDAFVNAAMILSGMGPVATLQTDGGKIFAGCYALFSGISLDRHSAESSLRPSSIASCTSFIWKMRNVDEKNK